MKHKLLFILLFALPGAVFLQNKNCLDPSFEDKCTSNIKSILDDYIYLRSRAFNSSVQNNVELYVPLKRNTIFIFHICEHNPVAKQPMIMTLYDSKNNPVASNYNEKTKKHSGTLNYLPKEAGRYYLKTAFPKDGIERCCIVTLGIINKNVDKYNVGGN